MIVDITSCGCGISSYDCRCGSFYGVDVKVELVDVVVSSIVVIIEFVFQNMTVCIYLNSF